MNKTAKWLHKQDRQEAHEERNKSGKQHRHGGKCRRVWSQDQAPSELSEAAEAEAEAEHESPTTRYIVSTHSSFLSFFFGIGSTRPTPWNHVSPSSMYCKSFHSFYDDEESITSGLDPIQSLENKIAEVTNELEWLKK